MNLKLFVATSTLSLMTLVAAGCQSTDSTPPTSTTTIIHDAPATKTATTTDAVVPAPGSNTNAGPGGATGTGSVTADAINTAIVRNTQMTGSRVTAVVDSTGTATLNGFVQNGQQKALAEKAAKDTVGVVGIKDKLEIRPTGGAGKTDVASKTVTSLSTGGDSSDASTAAAPAATPSPRVVVVNNYVPVPTQQQAPASQPSVNITVNPPASGGGGNDGGNNSNNGNGGNNFTGDDNDGSQNYPAYDPSVYNGVTPENPAVMSSGLVPNYLRNMALSRDYEVSQYPTPYGYYGVRSAPNQFGGNGFPSSYGSNGGYPVYIPANGQ